MHCQTCQFFNSSATECRRYAPQPSEVSGKADWPTVSATDWCGEYQAGEEIGERKSA